MLMRDGLFVGLAIGSLGIACSAGAQTSGSSATPASSIDSAAGTELGEIIVTALKRSQSVQDVAATVTVVTGDTLRRQNITTALALPSVAPGLEVELSPSNRPVVLIHGLGSHPAVASFDQSVSLFVDGVFEGHGQAYSSPLFDINDVEVIKGTQSALLGKNTSIGAVAVTTRKPEFKFGYDIDYSHEFYLNRNIVDGSINIPLSDTFAVRLAGQHNNQSDGWIHNDVTGQHSPQTDNNAGRVSLRWVPIDSLEWTLSYERDNLDQQGPVFFMAADKLGIATHWAALLGDPNFTVGPDDRTRQTGRVGQKDAYSVTDADRVTSTVTYDWAGYDFTVLTGYYRSATSVLNNSNALPLSPLAVREREEDEAVSQEFRVASPKIGRLDYVLGALYLHDRWSHEIDTDIVAPLPITGNSDNHYTQFVDTGSLFGQLNYQIVGGLKATAGLRGTIEKKMADFARSTLTPGLITFIYPPLAPSSLSRHERDLDSSFGFEDQLARDRMVYVSYSKGTKSGGFQDTPTTLGGAEYKAEIARTTELGAKLGLGTHGHVNIALFNTDVHNFQLGNYNGVGFVVDNIDLNSKGADLEVAWSLFKGLTAGMSGTYANTVNVHPSGAPTFYGSTVPFAPRWTGSASLNYSHPVGQRYEVTAGASVDVRTHVALTIASNTIIPPSQGYAKANLRLALNIPETGLEIAVVGRNLNDERTQTFGFQTFPSVPGSYIVSTDEPRTIALQVAVRR
jgi:iron complex outermembrane receptor protein